MFASPSHHQQQNDPYRATTPNSSSRFPNQNRTSPSVNNNNNQQHQNARATTPTPNQSSRRASNQHNRPTQISFAGFGNDEKDIPNDPKLQKYQQQPQTKNEAYFGVTSSGASPNDVAAAADTENNSFYDYHNQQQHQNSEYYNNNNQQHQISAISPNSHNQQQQQQQYSYSSSNDTAAAGGMVVVDEDARLQKCFQNDIMAAKPLFSARQISTRHLKSGFQLFGNPEDSAVLYTERMLQQRQKLPTSSRSMSAGASSRGYSIMSVGTNRNASVMLNSPDQQQQQQQSHSRSSPFTAVPEETASPVVIDYHDDCGHGKKTMRSLHLGRKQEFRDDAKAFVERNGISILGRMEAEQAAGTAKNTSLPGVQNRKNRSATPSSSQTHLKGFGMVNENCAQKADGSQFRFGRKVHPEQLHQTNLTRSLLPVRKILTPSSEVLASPPRAHGGKTARVGQRYAVDTNRVLCPDLIPISKAPRLRSLAPPEMLGQGMEIKEGAPQWTWKGGLKGDYWKHNGPTDPFGGEE